MSLLALFGIAMAHFETFSQYRDDQGGCNNHYADCDSIPGRNNMDRKGSLLPLDIRILGYLLLFITLYRYQMAAVTKGN